MTDASIKVTVTFEKREDGGLRVWSADVPGLVLSHSNIDAVLEDVKTAIEVILSARLGHPVAARPLLDMSEMRETLEDGGVVSRKKLVEAGPREYVAYVH